MPLRPAAPGAMAGTDELRRRTAEKAYSLYLRRDRCDGHDLEDWLQAERLVREELAPLTRQMPVRFRNTSVT